MKTHLLALLFLFGNHAALAVEPAGHAHPTGHDARVILALTPEERAIILDEMRQFLDAVQKMTAALARQDMPAAAKASRAVGQHMGHAVPPTLRAKLPMEFRQLGNSVHRDFDQMALDADTLGDVSHSLTQLSATLKKCVSCHATYQIRTPALNTQR
jgi:cytochrome c556